VLAPKGTPRGIVDKLAEAFKKMAWNKSVVPMIKQLGDEIHFMGPDDFARAWWEEYQTQKELAKIFKK
jgi:tripartite-type tricarboxylate transporter receptor subunit TctC